MITLIILQIICTSVVLYHIYKIKNNLDAQFKDLRYNQNLNNIDSNSTKQSLDEIIYNINSNESDKYEMQCYPHKYNVNDLIIIDFKNGKKHDVKRLKDERLFNGAVCMIKYHIPRLKKSDSINYIVSTVGEYSSNIYHYIVPENIIMKLSDSNL